MLSAISRTFHRLMIRPLWREPLRTAVTIAAIGLGVAAVLGMELAGEAAAGSFQSSVETLAGNADFEVTAIGGIAPEVLTGLAMLPYPLRLRPRIEDYAVVASTNRVVPFIGVDMLSDAQGDGIRAGDGSGFKPGDGVRLQIGDAVHDLRIRGVIPHAGEAIVTDLAPATRLLGRDGKLDRILVQTPATRSPGEWEQILRHALPPGVNLARAGAETAENRKMLSAFRWNLRVLSYIALVVGAFLVYNAMSVTVVRRRVEIAVARGLGATPSGVLLGFLGQALLLGLAGASVGIVLGRVLAEGATKLIGATVQSLYVSSQPGPIQLTAAISALAVLLGSLAAIASALAPALEASRVPPIEGMARGRREYEARNRRTAQLAAAAVAGALAYATSLAGPVDGKPLWGYVSAALMVAVSALAMPALVTVAAGCSAILARRLRLTEALLAARSVAASLRRTSVLTAALSTAVAMMVAVGIMVGSFRQTVFLWLEDRLRADLFLRDAAPAGVDRHPPMPPEIADRIAQLPEVAAVDRYRAYQISYQGMPATLGAGDMNIVARYGERAFLSGASPAEVLAQLRKGDNVIVSEPFANKHHIQPGDIVTLPLGGRSVRLRVVDIYYDYSSERGFIIMDRTRLLRYLPDPAPSNVAVYLRPGVPLEQGRRAVESMVAGRRILTLTNRRLRTEAMRVFDRTFAITYGLEAVAVFVAVMGVAGALIALVIDRRRELGLLRFLGGARAQVRRLILFEAGILGLFSMAAGAVLGVLLSRLLIFVINKQSFGWTIRFHWPVAVFLAGLGIVYVATVLAGLYPARMAARLNPIEVIHEE